MAHEDAKLTLDENGRLKDEELEEEEDEELEEEEEEIEEEDKYKEKVKHSKNKCLWQQRYTLAFMGFFGMIWTFSLRVNLSVAIVAMVKESHHDTQEIVSDVCPFPDYNFNESRSNARGELNWDEKTQGLILGSFYYLYGLTNIIGGRASEYFGGRLVVGVGITASGILTLLSPVAARSSSGLLIALRTIGGCFQGLVFPGIYTLIAKWYTTEERSKYIAFIIAGADVGNVITLSVSGWLCESDFLGGWPSVFYIPGVLTLIWGIFWFLLIRDDPRKHPRISKYELKFLKEGCPDTKERFPFPWTSVFTSRYFWTIVITQLGSNWGYFIILAELPTYLDKILHVQMLNNGLMSATPYLATWIFSVIYSIIIDKAIARGSLSILAVRRLSMAIAGYGPMLCMVAMCFANCSGGYAFTVLLLCGVFNGAAFCGFFSSHADIAPRFSGTLMGLSTAISAIASFSGPSLTGIIIEGNQTISAWRMVFLICACVYGVTTTIYEIFITTEQQPWNEPKR